MSHNNFDLAFRGSPPFAFASRPNHARKNQKPASNRGRRATCEQIEQSRRSRQLTTRTRTTSLFNRFIGRGAYQPRKTPVNKDF
jgi:hypothetical protein